MFKPFFYSAYSTKAEDFMMRGVKYLTTRMTYREINSLLSACDFRCFPLVDSAGRKFVVNIQHVYVILMIFKQWQVLTCILYLTSERCECENCLTSV